MKSSLYDVIVVGGGHAGVEACLVAARMGMKTLLVTNNLQRISYMSCNPSIGGLAKGHMVKEIDAFGGIMAKAADANCIQFKRLNAAKGPAVRGSRAQCDKDLYSKYVRDFLGRQKNLEILGKEVSRLILKNSRCQGIVTRDEENLFAKTVILATGTFMRGVMHIGLKKIEGGRVGDEATIGISDQLANEGFKVTRLKTGTPPRLKKSSIDWSKTESSIGDKKFIPFSFRSKKELLLPQIECFLAYTNEKTHQIIRDNLDKSPLFNGTIEGIGPRYCPSIEDKITRFKEKNQHQTFLEPEGLNSESIYLQGISTSLPREVQEQFLKTIPALKNVELLQPGYAVEYDFFEPKQIKQSLETHYIENLFFAGQISGTSGYEEAAAQGLLAGINAANKVLEKEPFYLRRDQAYMGVLIDDLVTKGTKEPYRMMTSRAEHRLFLREDNTLDRLAEVAYELGALPEEDFCKYLHLKEKQDHLRKQLDETQVVPNQKTQEELVKLNTPPLTKPLKLKDLLRRSEISCKSLRIFGLNYEEDEQVYEPVEIEIKYEGYIQRELERIDQAKKMEKVELPKEINYSKIRGLSAEEIEKLMEFKPRTLGQAQRISGVNPSAIQAILVNIKSFL